MIVDGVLSLYWPPMHLRGAEFTLTDTMHIVWAMVTVLLVVLAFALLRAQLEQPRDGLGGGPDSG
jgi:hypothetical protein